MEQLIIIGEFAKICKVTKKTLYFYEKKKLLTPICTNENGYRYYSVSQVDRVSAIKNFQNLGMTIYDIKSFFNLPNQNEREKVLFEKKIEVKNKINDLLKVNDDIECYLKKIDSLRNKGYSNYFYENFEEDIDYFIQNKKDNPYETANSIDFGNTFGIIFTESDLELSKLDYTYFFYHPGVKESNFVKKSGTYICCYRLLSNDDHFNVVKEFIFKHRDRIVGNVYYEDFGSSLIGEDNQYIIKLSARVKG